MEGKKQINVRGIKMEFIFPSFWNKGEEVGMIHTRTYFFSSFFFCRLHTNVHVIPSFFLANLAFNMQ